MRTISFNTINLAIRSMRSPIRLKMAINGLPHFIDKLGSILRTTALTLEAKE